MRDLIPQRIIRFILYLMVLSIPLSYTWRTYEAFNTPKEFIFKIGIILLTSIFLLRFLSRSEHELYLHPVSFPLLLFWLWGLGSALFSAYRMQSLSYYIIITSYVIFFYLIPYILRDYREKRIVMDILILASICISALSILQYLGLNRIGNGFQASISPLPKIAIYSTLGNPNFIASFLIGIAPIILVFILISDPSTHLRTGLWQRVLYIAGLATILAAIIILRSKGSYLGLIFSGLFLFWLISKIPPTLPSPSRGEGKGGGSFHRGYLQYRSRLRFPIVLTSILALALTLTLAFISFLPGGISPILKEFKGIGMEHPTIKGRLLMWHTALLMIRDHPISGLGPNTFGNYYQPYRAEIFSTIPDPASIYPNDPSYGEEIHAHNEYIQMASEIGVAGLILFLWLIYRLLKGCLILFNTIMDRKERAMVAGMIAGAIAILTHALVEFPLHLPATGMLFWLMLGIIFSIPFNERDILERLRPNKFQISTFKFQILGPVSYLVSLGILIIAGILIFYSFKIVKIEMLRRDAWKLMNNGKWHEAVEKLNKGIDLAPIEDGGLHFYLGVSYTQIGRYEESIEEYKKYYVVNPDFQVLYNIGVIYHRLKRYDLASDYYLSSIRFKPSLWEAYLRLAEICTERREIGCATKYYQKAKMINPRL